MSTQVFEFGDDRAPDWQPDLVGVVHDLRSPLGVASGYASLLSSGDLGELPDGARRAVAAITAKLAEARALVEGMLDVSRPDADVAAARRRESLDLRDLARAAVDRAAARVALGGDAVELEAGGPVPVRVDPRLLGRALDNLVNNALTHGRRPSHVVLSTSRHGGYGSVRVQDDGPGLPLETRGRLFLPGGGVPTDEGAVGVSSGLGLYLARALVEQCGGELRHEQPEAGGTAFVIELPLAH